MNTYLVVFDCCVLDEPYIKIIKADSLSECDREAYKISCGSGLSQGNYEIFRRMEEADYLAEPDFCIEEDE
jgi:hypothetical protein